MRGGAVVSSNDRLGALSRWAAHGNTYRTEEYVVDFHYIAQLRILDFVRKLLLRVKKACRRNRQIFISGIYSESLPQWTNLSDQRSEANSKEHVTR